MRAEEWAYGEGVIKENQKPQYFDESFIYIEFIKCKLNDYTRSVRSVYHQNMHDVYANFGSIKAIISFIHPKVRHYLYEKSTAFFAAFFKITLLNFVYAVVFVKSGWFNYV